MRAPSLLLVTMLLATATVLPSGCSTLRLSTGRHVPDEEMLADVATYSVVFHRGSGTPRIVTGTLEKPIHVQEALEQAGAARRYRAMHVDVIRPIEGRPLPLRLPVTWEASRGRVADSQNYAIMPGDRIVVRRTLNDPLDGFMSKISGNDDTPAGWHRR